MKKIQLRQNLEDSVQKKALRAAIQRKRKKLALLTTKLEELNMELDFIKHEYDVRVGRLLAKDNQLDVEIIRFKTIAHLLKEGLSYEEVMKKINGQYFSEPEIPFDENEFRKEFIIEDEGSVLTKVSEDIKALWKKLIVKFHPDLVTDTVEKTRREEIMKKINKAYTEGDVEVLHMFENELHTDNITETTVEKLEQILVDTENAIIRLENHYKSLQDSEWYSWKKKQKKTKGGNDIFVSLERELLDDIMKKIAILKSIKAGLAQYNIPVI